MSEPPARIEVRLPDGSVESVAPGTPAREVLQRWRPKEANHYLAAALNGVPVDLARRLDAAGSLAPLTFQDKAGREILEHSAAHLVA